MKLLPESVSKVQKGTVKGDALTELGILVFDNDGDVNDALDQGSIPDGQFFISNSSTFVNEVGPDSIYLCVKRGETLYRTKFDPFTLN